jgi:hypothetical protein
MILDRTAQQRFIWVGMADGEPIKPFRPRFVEATFDADFYPDHQLASGLSKEFALRRDILGRTSPCGDQEQYADDGQDDGGERDVIVTAHHEKELFWG